MAKKGAGTGGRVVEFHPGDPSSCLLLLRVAPRNSGRLIYQVPKSFSERLISYLCIDSSASITGLVPLNSRQSNEEQLAVVGNSRNELSFYCQFNQT